MKESQSCTSTPIGTFTETDPILSINETFAFESMCEGSAASSNRSRNEFVQRPLLLVPEFVRPQLHVLPSLPSIGEIDFLVKDEDRVMPCKVNGDAELYEKIKKLTDEGEEDERLEKLREEVAELERRKKLREEARA